MNKQQKQTILTGDRPTGPLHLGHYVGSLKQRIELQNQGFDMFVLIADMQALTDNFKNPQKVRENITQVALDYLSVGLDPQKTTIMIQSQIPELAELTMFFLNLVTIARLERNPTVKAEIKDRGFNRSIPAGFLTYPISQAADILAFEATIVPVGEDQLPMIEQAREIANRFNLLYGDTLILPEAQLSAFSRLPGTDGKEKMSKSSNNSINLFDSEEVIEKKVMNMFTDPKHLRVEDQGQVEGNPVFTYLDAFGKDLNKIDEMKKHYQLGGLGDSEVKKYLNDVLQEFLEPIRERRSLYSEKDAMEIIKTGTIKGRITASHVLAKVRSSMKINY